ncbi:hypothetical protein LCGC14_2287630 [marine sediment metagenome]|uniref:ERF family protein n=1 Tax=marine sediment metagenome TaxID=412755 RepID=A0A0F9CS06_9ZZZZ
MNDEVVEEKVMQNNTSKEIGELVKALAKVQGSIKPAKRESTNPFFKAKYADLTSVWDSCRKELSQNNLVIIQTTKGNDGKVTVLTTLAHESGQWIRGEISLRPVKTDPQGYGSALTYARRYSLAAMVGIATGEDDDAEDATRGKRKEKVKTTYLGNKVKLGDEQEKKAKAIDNIGETEVKDEPRLLSEEEAQKEQNKALGQKQEHDKEWQDKTRRTWHNLVKKMYAINYFADEPSYRAWMKQELNGKISYTKLTDAERVEGIGKMVGYANKYEQEKEK